MRENQGRRTVIDAVKTMLILTGATLLAIGLHSFGFRAENLLMLYAVAILLVITDTKKFFWGALSAPLCILAFNYFFTEPRFTFMVNDPNYFVSFGIFLVVAFIVSTLTTRLNNQISLSKQNEQRTNQLYKISSGYLNIAGTTNVISYGEKSLSALIGKRCTLYIKTQDYDFKDEAVRFCYESALPCGVGEGCYDREKLKYLPIKSGYKVIGVLSIQTDGTDIETEEMLYINTVLSQITLALERDFLSRAEETNRLNIEKEKLKTSLLRSISHDLRTPLTSIAGNAEFLLGSLESVDTQTAKSMLADIGTDAGWLSNMVENLLNMTRIQEDGLLINVQKEVVDDVIGEAVARTEKRLNGRSIKVIKPDEVLLVPMDGQLIIQGLVNLIDNCIKHTMPGTDIVINAYRGNNMVFEVSDNGGGIKVDLLEKIFDSFVTTSVESGDTHRGVGLGLSIVKSIVEAHGGKIIAENNQKGGATFRFMLPFGGKQI